MTRTAGGTNFVPDKVCIACNRIYSGERFPKGANKKRIATCESCVAKKNAPMPCGACGKLTAKGDFALRSGGRRSAYCHRCKVAPPSQRVCLKCKALLPTSSFERYSSGGRARRCLQCNRKERQPQICTLCKRSLPYDSFHRYPNLTRARTCHDCRKPMQRARTSDEASAVDLTGGSSSEPVAQWRGDLVLRPSAKAMGKNLKRVADNRKIAFTLNDAQIRKLHRGPCSLCGKHTSHLVLKDEKAGYVVDNCRPVCNTCKRLCHWFGYAQTVLWANEIAAKHPLDPKVIGCQCARSKLGSSSSNDAELQRRKSA